MKQNLNNKKIELFVDNGIDNYRRKEDITLDKMLKVYFDNEGFFVLGDENNKTIGYLDILDLDQIKKIMELLNKKEINYKKDTIKDLIQKNLIRFRVNFIDAEEKLIEVIKKMNNSEQTYFLVTKNNILIGRISKRIVVEKIKDLY